MHCSDNYGTVKIHLNEQQLPEPHKPASMENYVRGEHLQKVVQPQEPCNILIQQHNTQVAHKYVRTKERLA